MNPSTTLRFVETPLKTRRWLILGIVLMLLGSACQAPVEDQATQNDTKTSDTAEAANTSAVASSEETVASSDTTTSSGNTDDSPKENSSEDNREIIATTAASEIKTTTAKNSPTTTATQKPTNTPTTTTNTTSPQPTPGTSTTVAPPPTTALSSNGWDEKLLDGLIVSSSPAPVKYDRDDWGSGWSDANGNCMNARHEVLKAESVESTQLSSYGCTVTSGRWYAAFTGTWVTNPSSLDIDHFVPLANAHASGGWAWSSTTKRNYYNDLSDPKHLIAVTASANRSKGSRGPESWKPTDTSYWCVYAHSWATIKTRWELTVTANELGALSTMLNKCDTEPSSTWTPPAAPATTSSTSTSSTTTTTGLTNPGNTKNCSDFSSYAAAKTWFDQYFTLYGDVAQLDNDNDGEPCESLPGGPITTTTAAPTTTTTTTTIAQTTTTIPSNPGNTRNCSGATGFSNYAEAKAWFDTYFPYYGDVAKLDSDGDGEPCESLPGGP
jgi:hypothetical protein